VCKEVRELVRSTLDTFTKKLAKVGEDGEPLALLCPAGFWLVRYERVVSRRGAVVSEQSWSNYYAPCGRRTCEYCSGSWRAYHLARAFSGTNGVPIERLRFWTLTPPATFDDFDDYNRTVCKRFGQVWRQMVRRYPAVFGSESAYYGAKEFFRDGLIHLHVLVRQQFSALLPREDFGQGHWLQDNLTAHGFGPIHRWVVVDAGKGGAPGAVAYVTKYTLKASCDASFARGTRVDFWTRNWSVEWRQHQQMPRELRLPDGTTKIVTYSMLLPGESMFSNGRERRKWGDILNAEG
jgi:hypothetical protein